jgi:sulfur transfer protein SufE
MSTPANTTVIEPTDVPVQQPPLDTEVFARLAKMNPVDYDRARKSEAKTLGIQVKTLEEQVKAIRSDSQTPSPLPFAEVEPCDEPVEPAFVLNEMAAAIRRHIIMDDEQLDAVTLWVAFTWFIGDVEVAPLLIITAPEKACGKSQLLNLVGQFASRPLSAANSTPSFLFRAISAWGPTLLIDEADTFIRSNDDIKGLVNAGHTRANAFVGRTVAVGDTHEPRLFDVWGDKAFAGISLERHLPDATMSRGIVVTLRRKMAHETAERLRHANKADFQALASRLARFAEDYSEQVRAARPVLPEKLSDREQDNWEPLFAIAGCAGEEWLARAEKAALKLSEVANSHVSSGNELLADIQEIFDEKKTVKICTADLISALILDDDKAWATYNRGKPLTPRQLAKQLSAYGIQPKTVRMKYGTPKGYDADQFADAFARYLKPASPEN